MQKIPTFEDGEQFQSNDAGKVLLNKIGLIHEDVVLFNDH